MKLDCINKVRNASGNILYYVFATEDGNVISANKQDIIREMKKHEYGYEFINLQLDKSGRLVDKKIDSVDEKRLESITKTYIQKMYEQIYSDMKQNKSIQLNATHQIGSDTYSYFTGSNTRKYVDMLNAELVKQGCRMVEDTQFLNGFEVFLNNKEDIALKISVRTKSDIGFTYVSYGIDFADFCPSDEWVLKLARMSNISIQTKVLGKGANSNNTRLSKYCTDRYVENGLSFASFYKESYKNSVDEFIEKQKEEDVKYINPIKKYSKPNKNRDTKMQTQEIYETATKLGKMAYGLKRILRFLNMFSR